MSSKAYILIKTTAPQTPGVYEVLGKAQVVKQIDVVTGPYDIIAIVEAASPDALLEFLMREIRYMDGVVDTVTCFRIPMETGT